jgi:hypothetical protein
MPRWCVWSGGIAPTLFTSALHRDERLASRIGCFVLRHTVSVVRWVDSTAGLDAVEERQECLALTRAVGTATDYGLDDRGVGDRGSVGSRCLSSEYHPDRLWGPPSGYRGLFTRG